MGAKRMDHCDEITERFIAENRGVLYGTILGDATVTYIPSGKYSSSDGHEGRNGTCYLRIKHAADQRSLVEYKHEFMREIAGKISIAPYKGNLKGQDAYLFYTKNSIAWKKVYDEFYANARAVAGQTGKVRRYKRVTREILDVLNDQGFAWWIMDDGCYSHSNKGYGFFRLSTQGFSYDENELIKQWITDRYGVKGSLQINARRGVNPMSAQDTFVLYIGEKDFMPIKERVEPFIIPSLRHKIGCEMAVPLTVGV